MIRFVATRGPTRVVFAPGSFATLGAELDALGLERVLVLCSARGAREAATGLEALGGRVAAVLTSATEHVPAPVLHGACDEAGRVRAGALLGVGGGSAIGLGKAVAATTGLPLVVVPTTYSGSEMTSLYGVTEGGEKRTRKDERVRPRLVLYDPPLTWSLPLGVSVASAWNAMAHAVEALWFRDVDPVVALAAEESLRLTARWLPRLRERLDDADARDALLEASYLAGVALGDSGTALHHKLCHVLGGTFGLPHAATHATLLPHVVRYHREAAPEALRRIARALACDDAVEGLLALARRVDAPRALAPLGFRAEHIELAIDKVLALRFDNPRPLEREGLRELLLAALGATAT